MQPEQLTHLATNSDGTCSDAGCQCHEWAKQPNATRTGADQYHYEQRLRAQADDDHHRRAFDHAWSTAPSSQTRYTEQDSAEYWFETGRRYGREEQVAVTNGDLREMARIVKERLR
jgi:hypothetical protein